ncbi:MAG TPA: DciA family protein [Kiloniellales bacterium]|jgi:hypothetical protein|nr:DciA family protein [Kiloniellales bacterium]
MSGFRADRRSRSPQALARFVPKLTRPALRGFSRAEAVLLTDWEEIVGRQVATYTQPVKLTFPKRDERINATLHLRVHPAMALDLQHSGDLLAERINTHFGYGLVARLRLIQAPLHRREERRPLSLPPDLPHDRAQVLERKLAGIEDGDLRKALEALARAVQGGNSS